MLDFQNEDVSDEVAPVFISEPSVTFRCSLRLANCKQGDWGPLPKLLTLSFLAGKIRQSLMCIIRGHHVV